MWIISGLFGLLLVVFVALGFLIVGLIGAELLFAIITWFQPATPIHPTEAARLAEEKIVVQKIAKDFIQESIAAPETKVARRAVYQFQHLSKTAEWDTTPVVAQNSPAEDVAQWAVAKFPNGPAGAPRYLCAKISQGGVGVRTAFSAAASHRLEMDFESAKRWASADPDTFVVPANTCAEDIVRAQFQEANRA